MTVDVTHSSRRAEADKPPSRGRMARLVLPSETGRVTGRHHAAIDASDLKGRVSGPRPPSASECITRLPSQHFQRQKLWGTLLRLRVREGSPSLLLAEFSDVGSHCDYVASRIALRLTDRMKSAIRSAFCSSLAYFLRNRHRSS